LCSRRLCCPLLTRGTCPHPRGPSQCITRTHGGPVTFPRGAPVSPAPLQCSSLLSTEMKTARLSWSFQSASVCRATMQWHSYVRVWLFNNKVHHCSNSLLFASTTDQSSHRIVPFLAVKVAIVHQQTHAEAL